MEKYYYDIAYLNSLMHEQLFQLIVEHDYEDAEEFKEFTKEEIIEVLSNIVDC